MQTRERHHVDGQFPQVGVELTGEPEAGGDSRHGGADQVVEVAVGGRGQAHRVEADVVQSLVVDDVRLVGVLDQQVDGQGAVVGLHDGVGHLQENKLHRDIRIKPQLDTIESWTHLLCAEHCTTQTQKMPDIDKIYEFEKLLVLELIQKQQKQHCNNGPPAVALHSLPFEQYIYGNKTNALIQTFGDGTTE